MLELVYGNDRKAVEQAHKKILATTMREHLGVTVYHLDDISFSTEQFMQYLSGRSLFGAEKRAVVVCKDILEKKENEIWIAERLEEIVNSENFFFLVEREVSKEFISECKKHKIATHECIAKKKEVEQFNIFALTDMFGARKRKDAWLTFQKALREGITPEMILWKLQWQLKTMILASTSENEKDAGLHPFVYQKARGFASKFENGEISEISKRLIKIYEDDRAGRRELEFGLELMLLSI